MRGAGAGRGTLCGARARAVGPVEATSRPAGRACKQGTVRRMCDEQLSITRVREQAAGIVIALRHRHSHCGTGIVIAAQA